MELGLSDAEEDTAKVTELLLLPAKTLTRALEERRMFCSVCGSPKELPRAELCDRCYALKAAMDAEPVRAMLLIDKKRAISWHVDSLPKFSDRNRGKLLISDTFFRQRNVMAIVMAQLAVVVLEVRRAGISITEYVALSPHFDRVEFFEKTPNYEIVLDTEPTGEPVVKGVRKLTDEEAYALVHAPVLYEKRDRMLPADFIEVSFVLTAGEA